MVSYDDIETKEIGRKAKINELANLKIENDLNNEERQVELDGQQLGEKADAALTADAAAVIDRMDRVHDEGGDPMEIYSTLPPEMQERVSQLLQQERGPTGEANESPGQEMAEQQQIPQGFQSLPQSQVQMQGVPQQNNVNITDSAKRLAQQF